MNRPLHIAIPCRALSGPFGGTVEYMREMVTAMVQAGSPHRFTLYYNTPKALGQFPTAQERLLRAPHKLLWDHLAIPHALRRDRPDVVWFPQHVAALGTRVPFVVTVLDMLYFHIPEHPHREYRWPDILYMRAMMPWSLRKAGRIMTISDWTAHDIHRLLGIPLANMHTIHLAPSRIYREPPTAPDPMVLARHAITYPFFLYTGSLSIRKNVRTLVEAFGRSAPRLPHHLVMTGGGGAWVVEAPLNDLIDKYGIRERIHILGVIPRHELPHLYRAAAAFVFPSRYEGFGLPPVEAFACGCPVISTTATAMAEVVTDAALTFDPDDPNTLVQHLLAIANNPALRTDLIQAGHKRLQRFDYGRSASSLLALLEEAATAPPP